MQREVKVGDTTYSYKVYPWRDDVRATVHYNISGTECLGTEKVWTPTGFFRKKKLTPEMYAEAAAWAEEQLDLIERSNPGSISTQ